jgi:4-hydroxybenzoate polyprenyltransferase
MTCQTELLLLHSAVSINLLWFIFFSTICSYNFHWYLTTHSVSYSSRILWTKANKGLHLFLYLVGMIGSAVFFFMLTKYWLALFFGAFITFLYSAPKLPQDFFRGFKRIAIGKTFFLAFAWTYVTTVLPIIISGESWQTGFTLFALNRFFLIYAICILFDYRDRQDDKNNGIRSMITYLNENGINFLFWLSMILFTISGIGFYSYHHSLLTVATLLLPGLITAAVYQTAKKNFSDYLYYFLLDGLMMLSGLIMLIFTI